MALRTVRINERVVEVPAEFTLLQACAAAGIEIPRFCYHPRLSIAGNCRMCLVEVKGGPPKPVASCAMSVRDLRPDPDGAPPQIYTQTPMVHKARAGVMEFLLINHPLDCPICDQGGECDLQDQAIAYGMGNSRFHENKRAVEDKYMGPLVKTIMTRCIHCTRCVRFITEVAGVSDLGLIGRGEDAEITSYLEEALSSELQGNVIDLCPVGALTARPYAFQARPWELTKTESIDVMDGLGSAIRIDSRGPEVLRILPRLNEEVNEEWISDKTRFIWDGLRAQRLDHPYIRREGRLHPASWSEALNLVAQTLQATSPARVGALAGPLSAVEEMFALKGLLEGIGVQNLDARPAHSPLDPAWGRSSYVFGAGIQGIEQADALLLVGTNPRIEAAVLNARIRKRWLQKEFPIFGIGPSCDLTYPVRPLGTGPEALEKLQKGEGEAYATLKAAERPLLIIGQGALNRPDGSAVLSKLAALACRLGVVRSGWNGFCILHHEAACVGALEIGFVPQKGGGGLTTAQMLTPHHLDLLFLLGMDELDVPAGPFVVYIGTHGDRGAQRADVVLPGATYCEKRALYLNTEGRVQETSRAVFPPGQAREDWAILRALSGFLGRPLPYNTASELRRTLLHAFPHFSNIGHILPVGQALSELKFLSEGGGLLSSEPFRFAVDDFYMTNPIARHSCVMAESARLAHSRKQKQNQISSHKEETRCG